MEPLAFVLDKLKGLGKASQDLIDGLIHHRENLARRSPIEILKRLQREAFSDLMKLRDRQDKVERVLTFYNMSKGTPFQESSTRVRGGVDIMGVVSMLDFVGQDSYDALGRAGVRTGINSWLTFETTVRGEDTLVAEFVASYKDKGYLDDFSNSTLSLAKICYRASLCDWISAVVIPLGAHCRDAVITTTPSLQGNGLTGISSFGPPLLCQHNGSGIGLTLRKSIVNASLAQFVSQFGVPPHYDKIRHCLSTFGQVVCQLPKATKLSLLGLLQVPKLSSEHVHLGPLTIPVRHPKHRKGPETIVEASALPMGSDTEGIVPRGSVALLLESELDEYTRIGGWIEMSRSDPQCIQWAASMSDDSEDSFGWGMSVSGLVGGPTYWDHFQAESYLKLNLGKGFSVKPGVVYVSDGNSRLMALMVRSNWSF